MKSPKSLSLFGILIITTVLALQVQAQSFLTNGLVAYYPFNGNANDESGNGNNGIVNGVGIAYGSNQLGSNSACAHFAGGGFVSISPTPFNVNTNYSVSFWVKLDGTANPVNNFISTANDGQAGLNIRCVPNSPVGWAFMPDGPAGIDSTPPTNYVAWHSVVSIRQNSLSFLYIDGALMANGNISETTVDSGSLWIGREEGGADYDLEGSIDDVRIYNRDLSSNEVAELYAYASQPPVAPNITSQPQPITVSAGDNASFIVAATGSPPLSYQWSLNNTNIQGATNSTLTISNVAQTDLGNYAVVVTNGFGSVTSSNAMLSMYPFLESPFGGDVIDWGQNATLSVGAWGTGPLSYQWFDNGVAIQNATNQTLSFTDIQFAKAGLYTVMVSNPLGSVTNTPEQVVVNVAGVSLGFSPTLTINGSPGFTYIIQSSTNLANTNAWVTLTNLTLTQPMQLFIDTTVNASSPQNPRAFYQILPGQ
jgi:hypothetical protein